MTISDATRRVAVEALRYHRFTLTAMPVAEPPSKAQLDAIDAAIAELEHPAPTPNADGVWTPVEDGQVTSFLHIENDGSHVAVFAGDDYTDWYATEDLPDDIRLCRRTTPPAAVNVPTGALHTLLDYAEMTPAPNGVKEAARTLRTWLQQQRQEG